MGCNVFYVYRCIYFPIGTSCQCLKFRESRRELARLRGYLNFKQAAGSENIYGVFNVFVKKSVSICAIRGRIKKSSAWQIRHIRSITSRWSVDPEDKIRYIRSIRVQKEYIIRMANSCYSRYYIPLVSGSTTIGASLIVFVSLYVFCIHQPILVCHHG